MSHNSFDRRHYVIIPYAEVTNIEFNQILETDINTVRISIDGTKTFVKYENEIPSSVVNIEGRSQEYTHEEMIEILKAEEWVHQ